jgi:hypothetical protein
MFYKIGYLISALIYFILQLILLLINHSYRPWNMIKESVFVISIVLVIALIASIFLRVWIKNSDLKIRRLKAYKISVFGSFITLIFSEIYLIAITFWI